MCQCIEIHAYALTNFTRFPFFSSCNSELRDNIFLHFRPIACMFCPLDGHFWNHFFACTSCAQCRVVSWSDGQRFSANTFNSFSGHVHTEGARAIFRCECTINHLTCHFEVLLQNAKTWTLKYASCLESSKVVARACKLKLDAHSSCYLFCKEYGLKNERKLWHAYDCLMIFPVFICSLHSS